MKLELVIPTVMADLQICIENKEYFFRYLPITQIKFIGSKEIGQAIEKTGDNRLTYVNENKICDMTVFRKLIYERTKDDGGLLGWYYQQFLKLMYSFFCENEYYLIWDGDTLPIHNIMLFDEKGIPFFDTKTEYHEQYFQTLRNVLKMDKSIRGSFIAEHMLFKTEYVKSMIEEIENNNNLVGVGFLEKMVNAIFETGYHKLAFSEYETYGTYVYTRYQGSYALRNWKSLRRATWCLKKDNLNKSLLKWLVKYYDAITFEKRDTPKKMAIIIVNTRLFRILISAQTFDKY